MVLTCENFKILTNTAPTVELGQHLTIPSTLSDYNSGGSNIYFILLTVSGCYQDLLVIGGVEVNPRSNGVQAKDLAVENIHLKVSTLII